MQKTNIPFRKKINQIILSLTLFVFLVFLSNFAQINNNSQRMLAKFFEIPQALISEVYEQIAAFETERVVTLEEEIQLYQEKIYQQNLLIEELQNSGFFLFDKKNNFGEVFISGFDVVNDKMI
jgi:ABC-type microcin C transport system permease subunit YejE